MKDLSNYKLANLELKLSHKAKHEASSTNLDLKEGERCLAKHGDGRNGSSCVRFHGGMVNMEGGREVYVVERREKKWRERR